MSRRYEVSPEARTDLDEIARYLRANAGVGAAAAVLRRFRGKLQTIRRAPLIGVARPDLSETMRMSVSQRWIIYYEVTDGLCRVLRVLDGARDAVQVLAPTEGA